MPNPPSGENKRALREHCRSLAVPDPGAASAMIVGHIARLLEPNAGWQHIATFFPLPGEPDLRPLAHLFPDRSFLYPRTQGDDMTFHLIAEPDTQLVLNRWNLREPLPHLPVIDRSEIDLVLCPGMAFTPQGCRLGKGKGYYDRYLARRNTTRPHLIGVTYSTYLFEHLPCDAHDVMMDLVITDAGVSP